LIEPLVRFLSFGEDYAEITVIDGDEFEERNRERQRFEEPENKAKHTVRLMRHQFPKVHFRAKGEFLTNDNIVTNIREKDVVFLGVDNHASRKLVSDRCEELDDVVLISGGNDYTDGNVMLFVRKNGKSKGRPPTKMFSKIANPEDKNPGEFTDAERQSCQQEATTNPQLLFTNLSAASVMLNVFYAHEQGKANFEQVYFDILTQAARAVRP